MLGFDTAEQAKDAYMSNYEEGWQGFGSITPAGENFKAWLYDGKKQRKPYAEYKDTPNAVDNEQLTVDNVEKQTSKHNKATDERKQRILSEGTDFDKPFGLIPVSEIKNADEIQANIEKIIATLKANEGSQDNEIITKIHRLFLERIRKQTGKSVKHWCVTEKGHTNTRRIHLHGLFYAREGQTKWQLTKLLYENWIDGYKYYGSYVNEKTINYVSKYMTKKIWTTRTIYQ